MGGNTLRDRGGVTKIVSAKDLAAQTKLKYRSVALEWREGLRLTFSTN